jgi:hypothetical protein
MKPSKFGKQTASSRPKTKPQATSKTRRIPDLATAATTDRLAKATIVEAKADVGFGNAIFIRGEGDGLNWDKGQPQHCLDAETWVWSTEKARANLVFKLLLNDAVWARGENDRVAAGDTLKLAPTF